MKLEKVVFLNLTHAFELSQNEQKLIFGGYRGTYCCWWESEYDSGCFNNSTEAYHMGTKHWECNTDRAKKACGCDS